MLGQNADVAVLVTRTLPKDMQQFGEKSGVYLCNFSEVKSLALILRNAILKISESRKSQENKGEKMIALYNYLTSPEFTGNWNAMREGFGQLKGMLQKKGKILKKLETERKANRTDHSKLIAYFGQYRRHFRQ